MDWVKVILEFFVGCGLLAWGADRFIAASVSLSKKYQLSPLVIGMFLVGFGTSFPEIIVSIVASMHHKPELAMGNAVGSNIANIGLVLGVAALIMPLSIQSRLLKREFPLLLIISIVVGLLLMNGMLSRIEGIILLGLLAINLYWMFFIIPRDKTERDVMLQEAQTEATSKLMPIKKALFWWVAGLALLYLSSELIIMASSSIARWFKVSELVIGLSIVALGTSLPELAATISSVIKKEHDMAIGNIIGSNVFNLLAVLAMPALIAPGKVPARLIWLDYPVMLGFTLALWLFSLWPRAQRSIGRVKAVILLLGYVAFIMSIIVLR